MAQFDHLWDLLKQRWEKVAPSIDRRPLPDLHLLKNMGSSPSLPVLCVTHPPLSPPPYTQSRAAKDKLQLAQPQNPTKIQYCKEQNSYNFLLCTVGGSSNLSHLKQKGCNFHPTTYQPQPRMIIVRFVNRYIIIISKKLQNNYV